MSNLYKDFRRPGKEGFHNSINSRFDEPTYLTFNLKFNIGEFNNVYNGANLGTHINYDDMPHPLFMPMGSKDITDRSKYSSVDYLLDSNEFTRSRMLEELQNKLYYLQTWSPWYFQKIDGISDLLKVDPLSGRRNSKDAKITVTTLEGIDQRMGYILNMYKKIAWDDIYQRWMLPDMMRFFSMEIYISEYKVFHTPNQLNSYGSSNAQPKEVENVPENESRRDKRKRKREDRRTDRLAAREADQANDLWLNVLDDILPTRVIKCEMCEFDLSSFKFSALDSLDVGKAPEQATTTFDIKIGKIYEEQTYPIFKNAYLIDKALNGVQRYQDKEIRSSGAVGKEDFNSTNVFNINNDTRYREYPKIAQRTYMEEPSHLAGTPFNENANDKSLYGIGGAGPDGIFFTEDDEYVPSPHPGEGWLANAADWGTSFLKNAGESFVDKAKLTEIPGLGVSFTEITSAIQSKDIVTTLGLIKKGVNQTSEYVAGPSELLDKDISNQLFLTMLNNLSDSTATTSNPDIDFLKIAASLALTDNTILSKIADFSEATDMVSGNEINIKNDLDLNKNYQDATTEQTGGDLSKATDLVGLGESNIKQDLDLTKNYQDAILEQTGGDLSKATDLTSETETNIKSNLDPNTLIFEGIPSSTATTNTIIKT